jgi:hypothetical protein
MLAARLALILASEDQTAMSNSSANIGAGVVGVSYPATRRDAGHHIVAFDNSRGLQAACVLDTAQTGS